MTVIGDKRVCIVDYGSGNIRSVYNIFKSIHHSVKVSSLQNDIENATHLVLPGVGAFGAAMEKITNLSIIEMLVKNVLEKGKLFLGICIGMQILADKGHEHGVHQGLGWINGSVKKLETNGLCLPHIGWNNFKKLYGVPLMDGITSDMDFYYVHSYHFDVKDKSNLVATCEYGMEFSAAVNKENIYGVQFHPEKSQKAGRRLLQNFLKLS